MSDITVPAAPFFTLYHAGKVTEEQVSAFVGAWHGAGDEEHRSLAEYLGLTDAEYEVWVLDARTLPLIRSARQSGTPLRTAVASYLAAMRKSQRYEDGTAIQVLTHWVARNPAG